MPCHPACVLQRLFVRLVCWCMTRSTTCATPSVVWCGRSPSSWPLRQPAWPSCPPHCPTVQSLLAGWQQHMAALCMWCTQSTGLHPCSTTCSQQVRFLLQRKRAGVCAGELYVTCGSCIAQACTSSDRRQGGSCSVCRHIVWSYQHC